jgi:hypothetical protein
MLNIETIEIAKSRSAKHFIHGPVQESNFDRLISHTCIVKPEGNMPILYLDLDMTPLDELIPHLKELSFSDSTRKSLGENNKSILFGAVAASINRNNFCTYGAVAKHNTVLHKLLTIKYSTVLDNLLKQYLGSWQNVNYKLWNKSSIHEDYQLANSPWTSGIINKDSQHNYHFDDMNEENMLSGMITLKSEMSGGYLCFPEYQLAFEVKNRSLIFFCGKNLLHGVSPITLKQDGYRYTIVYYTTAGLKKCDSFEVELAKSNR